MYLGGGGGGMCPPPPGWERVKTLTMVSMETKVVSRDTFLDKLSEKNFSSMDSEKVNRVFARGGG